MVLDGVPASNQFGTVLVRVVPFMGVLTQGEPKRVGVGGGGEGRREEEGNPNLSVRER